MNGAVLSIGLDVLVLIFLGVTIYYAVRLTESLSAFRQTRQEFNAIMRELSRNIDDAQRSVEDLKKTTRNSEKNLQKTINDSRAIAAELESLNQKSSSLLSRTSAPSAPGDPLDDEALFGMLEETLQDEADFSIHDPEFENPAAPPADLEKPYRSQAERDLHEALQRSRKASGRGVA